MSQKTSAATTRGSSSARTRRSSDARLTAASPSRRTGRAVSPFFRSPVAGRRAVGASILASLEAAATHWAAGDKALANLRLVFAGLPRLVEPADVYRLQAAAYCLDEGLAPRDLMKTLDLDPSALDLTKLWAGERAVDRIEWVDKLAVITGTPRFTGRNDA